MKHLVISFRYLQVMVNYIDHVQSQFNDILPRYVNV